MLRLRPVRRGGRDSAQHDVVIVFFFLLLLITPLRAADRLDLFYYVPYDDSWLSLQAHAGRIGVLGPQVLMLDAAGAVRGGVEERVRQLAADSHMALMPLLANEKPEYAHVMLVDPALRARAIADMLAACAQVNGVGMGVGGAERDTASAKVPTQAKTRLEWGTAFTAFRPSSS